MYKLCVTLYYLSFIKRTYFTPYTCGISVLKTYKIQNLNSINKLNLNPQQYVFYSVRSKGHQHILLKLHIPSTLS